MNRTRPYDVPHKALRNALSQLSLLAGNTNYANHAEAERIHKLGQDVFEMLTIHAKDENEVTLAELEVRCPGSSKHDMDDHEKIHVLQHKLEELLAKLYADALAGKDTTADGAEFYLALSEFHSLYLEHTATEERVTQPLLWKHFTDEELAMQRGKIMAKIPPENLLRWFKFAIPAMSHNERTGLLTGFKKMAPAPFFEQGMHVIKQEITQEDFTQLNKAIGV